ncbi:T9SS type A sorting domain-containing protein [Flavobacterium sp. 3HN19-14]|uniref:T9SS type A sorting domain-containing protein n=1 Tax=Flavobacterium sp. 3HN19-14 TaxID=3448133 RepID=UPI003EDF8F8E
MGVGDLNTVKFTAYPNPTKNAWNFTSSKTAISSVTIVDVLGKTVLTQDFSSTDARIDATSLPQGMYFAKVTAGENTQTIKVVKN